MESLSRPPHRRKHSTTTNSSSSISSFSLKNPYDDVLFSNGGKAKFRAHEYAEIFSGSSSIPVLNLSGLDERFGSGDYRSSKLDYSSIFGGLSGNDVAVPYEELVNAAQKKTKTRIPVDAQSPYQEPVPLHSLGKTKRSSGDTSDQSTGEIKQHVNMSFNKASPTNRDTSNGETHVAQLHAVPGFTYFVDGTPRQSKTEGKRHLSSMKCEVSRTWSFSAGAEEVITVKGGLNSEKSHVHDKSHNLNEIKPISSNFPSGPNDNEDVKILKSPSFASRDASDKSAGEYLPPLFEEALDENSVAAVSAAALKKAIEQAQESIRIAKMIMERKKEGVLDSSVPRSKGRLRKDKKKIRIDCEAERVRENVGAAKEHGDALTEVGKKFVAEEVGFENVEANEACRGETDFTGLVANAECETMTLESEKVDEHDNSICSTNKFLSHLEDMKSGLEQCESTFGQTEPENIAEMLERVVKCSPNTQEKEKIMRKAGESLRVSEKDEVTEERANEEVVNGEHLTELKSEFSNNLLNKSGNPAEKHMLEQEDMKKNYENVRDLKENCLHGKSTEEELSDCETEPEIFPEIGKKVNEVHVQEIDEKKLNRGHDGDGQKLNEENKQNEIAERHLNNFECQAAKTIHMEANNSQDADETKDILEENRDKFEFQEAVSEKDSNDEAVDACGYDSGVSETHSNNTSTVFSETEEHYDVDLNNKAEDNLHGVTETFSDKKVNEISGTDSLRRCASEENFIGIRLNNGFEGLSSDSKTENVGLMDRHCEQALPEDEDTSETAREAHVSTHESQECTENAKDNNTSSKDELKDDTDTASDEKREYVKEQNERDQNLEKNKENFTEQKDSKGNEQKFETDDQQQRIEAIKRGREREKDRIAVERAIREARERAFDEARERAERERTRQRVKAEAHEKPADKASIEAKVRAERAAVERATAEARERALEKAKSQKTNTETRTQADRFSSSSRSNGLKHSFSSSDLEKFDGTTSESAQRRKARLERHQRIMERSAKALAEKNMRDFLVQKEQAERNRLAVSLDADIKRWVTGKEGNLRALLSTLQYILGPDSGWQAIPLTQIITTAAVKKAYRKATLCVHPDKLQQRGASIKQKYICEKVFDLLKAAWNRFNSEER